MFNKWINEIGSHNPKHIKRINRIKNIAPMVQWISMKPCGDMQKGFDQGSNPCRGI